MNYDKIYYENNEEEIRELLLYRKVVKVEGNTLILDNGTELTFKGNEGCSCGNGWYYVTELNECDNVITNVEFVRDDDIKNKDSDDDISYKIFVYAEDRHIKLAQIDGNDGNGFYGTGYTLYVKFKEN